MKRSSTDPSLAVAGMRSRDDRVVPAVVQAPANTSIEERIEAAVERAVERMLRPLLQRISQTDAAVYTVAQAAALLQVSDDTVWRMVKRGTLPRVPLLDGKVLIPKRALDRLLDYEAPPPSGAIPIRPPRRPRPRSEAGP